MDEKKKYKYIQVVLVVGALLLAVGLFRFFSSETLTFDYHKDLSTQEVTDLEFKTLIAIHRDCFEETKRRNLLKYLSKYQAGSLQSHTNKVSRIVEDDRVDQITSFRNTQNVYVARLDQKIIGLFNCREENQVTQHSIMIFNVCLTSSMRGKGFGAKLMKHAHEHCPQKGKDLTLTVYKDDAKVIQFYKDLNYKIVSSLEEWDHDFTYFNKYLLRYEPLQDEKGAL